MIEKMNAGANKMAKKLSRKCFVISFNVFFFICGIILLIVSGVVDSYLGGGSSYVRAFFAQEDAWLGIFNGLATIIISLVGIYAIQENYRNMLFFYIVSLILILCSQIGFANSLVIVSQKFSMQETLVSGALTRPSDAAINNLVLSAYVKCCTGCPVGCNNTLPGAYSPTQLPYCPGTSCESVGPCRSKSQDKCFNYFARGRGSGPIYVPTDVVDDSVCSWLSRFSYGTSPLVVPAVDGGCGFGDGRIFYQNLQAYVSSRSYGSAVGLIFLAVCEILILIVCMYIVFCAKHSVRSNDYYQSADSLNDGVLLQNPPLRMLAEQSNLPAQI